MMDGAVTRADINTTVLDYLNRDPARLAKLLCYKNHDRTRLVKEDLRGVDFTGASLVGVTFHGALIERARFDRSWVERSQLREAADWDKHVDGWTPPRTAGELPHRVGERFSEAPFAPEMVMLPGGVDPRAPGRFRPDELEALLNGRLAVAAACVSCGEVAGLTRRRVPRPDVRNGDWEVCAEFDAQGAAGHVDGLNAVLGDLGRYQIPSIGLLSFLADRYGSPSDASGETGGLIGLGALPEVALDPETDRPVRMVPDTALFAKPRRLDDWRPDVAMALRPVRIFLASGR